VGLLRVHPRPASRGTTPSRRTAASPLRRALACTARGIPDPLHDQRRRQRDPRPRRRSPARYLSPLNHATLNPRVRGSSPWRRTRTDLGFSSIQVIFMCPFCPHVGSMFARELGPGRGGLVQSGRIRARAGPTAPEPAKPMVYTFARRPAFGCLIQLRSVKPAGSVESHERRPGRAGHGQPEVPYMRG
jgi:hypothetical protein